MAKLSKVEFLQTTAGAYGIAHTGDKLVIDARVAKELEEKGALKITGEAGDGAEESIPTKGSVRFIDETNAAKKQGAAPAGETDEKNPTGPDKPSTQKVKPVRGATKTSKK
jgi:hypothetical protein